MDLDAVLELEDYWEEVRTLDASFEQGLASPIGRVYRHQIPVGQLSNLVASEVLDREHAPEQVSREHADPDDPRQLAEQVTSVVTIAVDEGAEVEEGPVVGTIEAMKMESPFRAHVDGTIARVVTTSGTRVEPGDLLVEITRP